MAIGGLVEVDESPEVSAVRQAREEAGVELASLCLLAAMGGPDFRGHYPNSDEVAYVSVVYQASVASGEPRHDGEETSEVGWFHPSQILSLDLGALNRRLLSLALPLLS